MRNAYLLLLSITIFLSACTKEPSNPTSNVSVVVDSSYIINGIQNMNITLREKKEFPLIVQFTNKGGQELINLKATGMPKGVSIYFTPNGGIPSFNTVMTVDSKLPANGNYPIKIEGTSTSGKTRSYEVTLNVSGALTDCASLIVNNAEKIETTIQGDTKVLFADTEMGYYINNTFVVNNLVLRHLPTTEVVVFDITNSVNFEFPQLIFDCDKRTVTMPETVLQIREFGQSANVVNYTVSGSGTFNADVLEIIYTSKSSKGNNTYRATAKLNL